MTTLHFQQIVDSRFNETLDQLNSRVSLIREKLTGISNINVSATSPRKVTFGPPEPCEQYRVDFYISKNVKGKPTWDTIYSIVNSVYPVPYKFEK